MTEAVALEGPEVGGVGQARPLAATAPENLSSRSPVPTAQPRAGAVDTVVVVVPARNEQTHIGRCLDALAVAAARVRLQADVHVVVVLDACTDATAAIVAEWTGVQAVVVQSGRMGPVRGAGVAQGVEAVTSPSALVWVAHTDADSVVPSDWLEVQLSLAAGGADLVLGTVEPDERARQHPDARVRGLWAATHLLEEGHEAVHGANLGVRLSAYRAVGGYGQERDGEDVALAVRVRKAGYTWVATDRHRVLTSARRSGRAEHGFAQFLRRLDQVVATVGDVTAVERRLREAVLDLARQRGVAKSLCPSEAARAVDPEGFRGLMPLAREAAFALADEGLVEIIQHGERVDGRTARGPIRIRLVDTADSRNTGA